MYCVRNLSPFAYRLVVVIALSIVGLTAVVEEIVLEAEMVVIWILEITDVEVTLVLQLRLLLLLLLLTVLPVWQPAITSYNIDL